MNLSALDLIVERSACSILQKSIMKRRLRKAVKRHGLAGFDGEWRYRYCCARLALGDYSDYSGWECRSEWAHELYWKETWLPKWGGGYVPRLLVLGEQGIGDEVMYASIIPEAMVRVGQVIYECDDRLHSLLQRSLPGLVCESRKPFEERREVDAFIPAAELMRMFRRRSGDFTGRAFLRPDKSRVEGLAAFDKAVAISWAGRQGSIEPGKLTSEHTVSVQYGAQVAEVEQPGFDLTNDIEGVVALCSVVKEVVTVPTSVMHFAGGVGAKVSVVWPEIAGEIDNQIRWDHSLGKHPFYPNVHVYRNMNELCKARGLAVAG